MAEGDTAFRQIVGGKLKRDFVARQNADAIAPQPARQVGQHYAVMFELDAKQSAGEFFKNCSGNLDAVFFAHKPR
jgi:hypothetical protein